MILANSEALTSEIATTSNGRKVILNNDGTWKNLSEVKEEKRSNKNYVFPQKKLRDAFSNASYEVLNTFTTIERLYLCMKVSNNTADKITEPVFSSISCSNNGQACVYSFSGLLTDGNGNNLRAKISSKIRDKFLGVPPYQITLYPKDSLNFTIFAKKPLKFSNMRLNIDGAVINFDAIKKIQSLPKFDTSKRSSHKYKLNYEKDINKLVCKGHKTIDGSSLF